MNKKRYLIIFLCVILACAGIVALFLFNHREKHIHAWDLGVVTNEPSCTTKGLKTYTCIHCGATRAQELATVEHTWDEGSITTPSACTTDGVRTLTCTACGALKNEALPATGHTWEDGAITLQAACTANGEKELVCSICGEISKQAIPALGHTWDNAVIINAPECISSGQKRLTCSVCGESKTEKIPALGHDYNAILIAPTCTEEGFTTYLCTRCEDSYTGCRTATTEHAWNQGMVIKEATGDAAGEKFYTCTICGAVKTEGTPALGHNYTALVTPPTCTEIGYTTYTCKDCDSTYKDSIVVASGHTWDKGTTTKEPTEIERGIKTYTCTLCETTKTEVLPAFGDPSTLYSRVDADGNEDPNGSYILFGNYPQSLVTDETLKESLNAQIGAWISYPYYIASYVCDFMYYQDVTLDGEAYRGVYFTSYRPFLTKSASSTDNSYQDNNGYITDTIYWFRYDPIKWRILSEENQVAFLLCESIVDSQVFQDAYISTDDLSIYYNNSLGTPDKIYANNYEYSAIRAWLNESFYQTAFDDLQQVLILITSVDNSAKSTNPNKNPATWNNGKNQYLSKDTQDKIFLLSEQEVTNSAYGFSINQDAKDTIRQKQSTDYAKVQGLYADEGTYSGNSLWWLRSPYAFNSLNPRVVQSSGVANYYGYISCSSNGVVPALQLRLK